MTHDRPEEPDRTAALVAALTDGHGIDYEGSCICSPTWIKDWSDLATHMARVITAANLPAPRPPEPDRTAALDTERVALLIHDVSDPGELGDEHCVCRESVETVIERHPWLATLPAPRPPERTGVQKLAELAQLPNNWDSYGAERITFEVHQEALRFYDMLVAFGVPEPFIVPCSDGAIAFEWDTGETTEISVKVGP